MISWMTNFIVVFILLISIASADDPCRFEYPGKGVIDITTLGHTDGSAAFADQFTKPPSNYKYSYNPCKPFTSSFYCQNVAACQTTVDGYASYVLGVQDSVTWSPGNDSGESPSITYSGTIYGRTSRVILECSTNGSEAFEVLGEGPEFFYSFRLTHKCACWNGCTNVTSTTTTTTTTTTITPTTSSPASSACRFEYPGKGVIDFSFIGRTDEKAAYSDESTRSASSFKYSYNPCRSFSQGANCIGVSVCQISNIGQETSTLGTQESAWWDAGSDVNILPSVNYVYGDKKVKILLQCSNQGENVFQALGEDPVNTFRFQLTHKCACWNECSKKMNLLF